MYEREVFYVIKEEEEKDDDRNSMATASNIYRMNTRSMTIFKLNTKYWLHEQSAVDQAKEKINLIDIKINNNNNNKNKLHFHM